MFKRVIVSAVIALTAHGAMAEDAKVAELANTLHMRERIDEMRAQANESQKRQIEQVLGQLEKSVPNMNAAQRAALRDAATKMLNQVLSSWSSEEAGRIYTGYLAANLPPAEVAKTIAFYATPEGQKALAVIGNADKAMINYITSTTEKSMAVAYPVFMNELKASMAPPAAK